MDIVMLIVSILLDSIKKSEVLSLGFPELTNQTSSNNPTSKRIEMTCKLTSSSLHLEGIILEDVEGAG